MWSSFSMDKFPCFSLTLNSGAASGPGMGITVI